jgi:hypothetical protein
MNTIAGQLTTTIQNAIADTEAAYPGMNIRFAATDAAFDGHRACDPSPYLNNIDVPVTGSFHPNLAGQVALGNVINNVLK